MSRDDENRTEDYDDRNRAFLQAVIARSTITFEEAKPLIAAIEKAHERKEVLAGDITEAEFSKYLSAANDAISPFDLEIRSTQHQITRERVYAFINSTSDALTQLATIWTPDEISYLKRLLDAMFETNNTSRHELLAVSSTDAINLCKPNRQSANRRSSANTQSSGADQGISGLQAQRMLDALLAQGWFERSRKGYYSLSPRALMELRGWLLETYNDEEEDEDGGQRIKMCYACKDIVTVGQRCPKLTCECRIHDICTQRYFTMQRNRLCPICKTEWTGEDFVGERATAGRSNGTRTSEGHTIPETNPEPHSQTSER